MGTLRVGDRAPAFVAKTHEGKSISLEDFRGRHLVLYFYPRAFTAGCTVETKTFRDHEAEIEALGASIVGVSMDEQQTQCAFADEHHVSFPLIADTDARVCDAFDAVWPLVRRPKRLTFIVGPDGRIAAIFRHELGFARHVHDVLAFLKAERRGVAAAGGA